MFTTKPINFFATTTFKPEQEELLWDLFIKLLDNYDIMGLKTNLLPSMKLHYRVIRLDCLIILLQINWLKEIEPMKQISNLSFQNRLL
jgi:hypothetical protein